MDPNSNLQEQLRLAGRIQMTFDKGRTPDEADCGRLAELVLALDDWIKEGGALPKAWREKA